MNPKSPTVQELLYAAVFPDDPIADWSKAQLAAIVEKYKRILSVYDKALRKHKGEAPQRQPYCITAVRINPFTKPRRYQVAAFESRKNAYAYVDKLKACGYKATVTTEIDGKKSTLYKVYSDTAEVQMLGEPVVRTVPVSYKRSTSEVVEHIEKIANHLQRRGLAYNRTDALAKAWNEHPELMAEYDEAYRREEGWH